jgi:hypothetical protein
MKKPRASRLAGQREYFLDAVVNNIQARQTHKRRAYKLKKDIKYVCAALIFRMTERAACSLARELYSNRRPLRVHRCAVALYCHHCLFCQAARHYVILWCRNSPGISHCMRSHTLVPNKCNTCNKRSLLTPESSHMLLWEMIISHLHVPRARAERTRRITLGSVYIDQPPRERTAQPERWWIFYYDDIACVWASRRAWAARCTLKFSLWHPHTSTHTNRTMAQNHINIASTPQIPPLLGCVCRLSFAPTLLDMGYGGMHLCY